MKKLVLPLLLCLLMLCACGSGDDVGAKPTDTVDENTKVIASGEGFSVEQITKDGNVKYRYTVTDLDGAELESAYCAEMPKVAQVSKTLIGIRFTDGNNVWTRYFDLKNAKISESFMDAFWSDGTLVAYSDFVGHEIVAVRDIFDADGFYAEVELEGSDLWRITVIAAEVSEDGETLTVEYVDGDGKNPAAEIKTAALPLTDTPAPDGEE